MSELESAIRRCIFAVGMSACAEQQSAEVFIEQGSREELENAFYSARYMEKTYGLTFALKRYQAYPVLTFRWQAEQSPVLRDQMAKALTRQQRDQSCQGSRTIPEANEQVMAEAFFCYIIQSMIQAGRGRFRLPCLTLLRCSPEGGLEEVGFETALEQACARTDATYQYVQRRKCYRVELREGSEEDA